MTYILSAVLALMVLALSIGFAYGMVSELDTPRSSNAPRRSPTPPVRSSPKPRSAAAVPSQPLRVRAEGKEGMDGLVAPLSSSSPLAPLSPPASSPTLRQPPPRQPSASSARGGKLCPGLVVPFGQECVLAVRAYANAAAGRVVASDGQPVVIDVLDMHGKTVLSAHVAPPPPALAPPAFVSLLTPRGETKSSGGPNDVQSSLLSECRFDGVGGLNIYNSAGELFGVFLRDLERPRYSFVGHGAGLSGLRMSFDVSSHDRMVVRSEIGEQLADTEPISLTFDPQGKYHKVRVASGVDVGLILSGIFAIEAMEAPPGQQ